MAISIHAPREGGRRKLSYVFTASNKFQSTPPVRGGDHPALHIGFPEPHFNPRPP